MKEGDIFVNKKCPIVTEAVKEEFVKNPNLRVHDGFEGLEWKSAPERYKGALPAYVDRVILTANPEEAGCQVKMI